MLSLPSSSSAPPCDELAQQGHVMSRAGRQPPAPPYLAACRPGPVRS